MRDNNDIDFLYELMTEGRLNLMYLPSGAVAWLYDRPEPQIGAAEALGIHAKDTNPIVDACLLRSDNNVLILTCKGGQKFHIYPDGGYSFDGQPMGLEGCQRALENVPDHEQDCGCPDKGMIPRGDVRDGVVAVVSPEGFSNMARAREDVGGDNDLAIGAGMGTGTPYTDIANDVIDNMDMFGAEDDQNWGEHLSVEEWDGVIEGVCPRKGIVLDEDRLSFQELTEGDVVNMADFKKKKKHRGNEVDSNLDLERFDDTIEVEKGVMPVEDWEAKWGEPYHKDEMTGNPNALIHAMGGTSALGAKVAQQRGRSLRDSWTMLDDSTKVESGEMSPKEFQLKWGEKYEDAFEYLHGPTQF